jgi:hypothetical protein
MQRAGAILLMAAALLPAASTRKVTFYKDVLPILQNRCQECHRSGEIGPMEFTTYKQTRPWAKAIRESVAAKRMPPWFADPNHGTFANDRSLPQSEVEALLAWVDAGAPEGSAKDQPPEKQWTSGWNIPRPDSVIEMPAEFTVPANGKVDYQYIIIPTNFKEDKWVRMVEARPSNRRLVHHAVIFVREPGNPWLRGEAEPGRPFVPPRTTAEGKPRGGDIDGFGSEMLTVYTPGNLPDMFKPTQAKLIKAGSDLVFQMHYTANGTAGTDKTAVGLVFAPEPPKERVITVSVANTRFTIPPGDPDFHVPLKVNLPNSGTLLSFFPHMHLRGKAFEYKLQQPGEAPQTLLKVNKYDFNWQLTYRLATPIEIKPGAKMDLSAWFDNSPNNPYNPDPKASVRWGEQSWEEMMVGFFDVAVPREMDRRSFLRPAGAQKKSD